MSKDSDFIGDTGESAMRTALLRTIKQSLFPGYPRFLFKPIFLGEKAELFDFLVYLRDKNGDLTGAHFFVQVKSTEARIKTGQCPAPFSADAVKTALTFKVPSYLCAVKIGAKSKVYVRGLSYTRKRGFAGVGTQHNLNDADVRVAIYDEVANFFTKQGYKFSSAF